MTLSSIHEIIHIIIQKKKNTKRIWLYAFDINQRQYMDLVRKQRNIIFPTLEPLD